MTEDGHYLVSVRLAETLAMPPDPDLAHEIRVAIYDLVEENLFRPANGARGPFHLVLQIEDNRLILLVGTADGGDQGRLSLPLVSLRRLIKDYAIVCDSYADAVRSLSPSQIEAIDMGRRGLHNEAGELLRAKLAAHVEVDLATARRLFTLVYALLRRR
jgi:uncharacterized protein (UPF0262 family)